MLKETFSLFDGNTFGLIFSALWNTKVFWVPILLFSLFMQVYLRYIRAKYIVEEGNTLLEIRIPKEQFKSPAAMEIVLQALSQPSVGNYLDVFLKGRIRRWFSLELVSIEGQVSFFIWTHKKMKNMIESQIYSQYPTVEVHEVPDYSLKVVYDPGKISMWGAQFKLNKADIYPIKTYIDYGLGEDPKEEFKIDPLTPVLEFLGSLRKGEQAWYQIIIQAHRKEGLKDALLFKRADWKGGAKKEIEKIFKESYIKPEEGKSLKFNDLSQVQKDTITAVERSVTKTAFDSMIRAIYVAEKDSFNSVNIGGLTGSFKQFGSENLNSFSPKWSTKPEYPWQDFQGRKKMKNERKLLDAYKRRSFFHPPYKNFHGRPFILNVEELATIYHFPGQVAPTPTLQRIPSKKSEPPANLPL
ncbi:MAG TPA: hypothetical protein VJC12_00125 [Candidatus Paceibacterota bacterium]